MIHVLYCSLWSPFCPLFVPYSLHRVFEYRPVIIGEAKKKRGGDQKGRAGVSLTFLAVTEVLTQMFVSSCLKSWPNPALLLFLVCLWKVLSLLLLFISDDICLKAPFGVYVNFFSLLFCLSFFFFLSFHNRPMVMRKTCMDHPRVENLAGLVDDFYCYKILLLYLMGLT